MQLQLKYSENAGRPVHGAFVQGASPVQWFSEMNLWNIDLRSASCYIMPQSIADNTCAGLFVIFREQLKPASQVIKYPYSRIGDRLFIPVKALLHPVVGTDELKKILLWDVQVFHPVIGLVGFEGKDEVDLAGFIKIPLPKAGNWNFAHPGLPDAPLLQMISLEPDKHQDILEEIKEDVGSKPLSDVPLAGDGKSAASRVSGQALNLFARLGLYLLLVLAFVGKVVFTFFGLLNPFKWLNRGASPGLLQQMEKWVNRKLEDLEKQRDSELKRLMSLFDKDTDEALKYAIPLSNNYLNRGMAPPSAKLTRKPLQFNLFKIGGGGRVDVWNVDAYAGELRKRYERSANEAVESGNFKKAAYIYAHLLGNLYAAANVLKQGKYFREAAALYKGHLKNTQMAADCLEKGGLLTEAIPLYIEMGNWEKAGDLHAQLGQQEAALKYYRQTVADLKQVKNYQHAAKLTMDKMLQREDALNLLLDGWQDVSQPEACLKKYFELSYDAENNHLAHELRHVYSNFVPRSKRTAFLNVLTDINQLYPQKQLEQESLGIAYEIVHQQVEQGDTSGLKLISKLLPEDKLLSSDATRFINNNLRALPVNYDATYLNMGITEAGARLIDVVAYHDQVIAIFLKKNDLHLLRANWEGKNLVQYINKLPADSALPWLLADQGLTDQMFIACDRLPGYLNIKLDAYSFFYREATLRSLNWLPERLLACCLNSNNGITVLHYKEGLLLSHFKLTGELIRTNRCEATNKEEMRDDIRITSSAMMCRKDQFYCCLGTCVLRILASGHMEVISVGAEILAFSITEQHAALKIALLTDNGCLLIAPTFKEMKIGAGFFAQDFEAGHIKLLNSNRLAIASGKQAALFDLKDGKPELLCTIGTKNEINAIMAIPKRDHCAFLETDNRISIYNLYPV